MLLLLLNIILYYHIQNGLIWFRSILKIDWINGWSEWYRLIGIEKGKWSRGSIDRIIGTNRRWY